MTGAALIMEVSLWSAAALSGVFGLLLGRRWLWERRGQGRSAALAAITRHYLLRVGGHREDAYGSAWPAPLRLAAVRHLHLLLRGDERHRLMQLAELDGLLEATLRQSGTLRAARRIDAIRLLQQFGSEACVARLRVMLTRDRHPEVRVEAAFALAALAALPPPRELVRILAMFERAPGPLDSALLRAAAPLYPDHFVAMLADPMPPSRRALLVDALGFANDLSVLPALQQAAHADDPELRSAALRAAGKVGHPSMAAWVVPMLDDPVAFVRIQAANCCAALGLYAAVPRLQRCLADDDLWVRLRAEHALDVLLGHTPRDSLKDVA